jgi:hypothetical protein
MPGSVVLISLLGLAAIAPASTPAPKACIEERGLRFCASISKALRPGEYLELDLTTTNFGTHPVTSISLAKVPEAARPEFIGVSWANQPIQTIRPHPDLRPEYVVDLAPGGTIVASVQTHLRVASGRHELVIDAPYWWPDESPHFSESQRQAFAKHAWRGPKEGPLMSLVFEVN